MGSRVTADPWEGRLPGSELPRTLRVLVASVQFIQGSCHGPRAGSQPTSPPSLCTLHTPCLLSRAQTLPRGEGGQVPGGLAPSSGPSARVCPPRCPGPRLTPPRAQPRAWPGPEDGKRAAETARNHWGNSRGNPHSDYLMTGRSHCHLFSL